MLCIISRPTEAENFSNAILRHHSQKSMTVQIFSLIHICRLLGTPLLERDSYYNDTSSAPMSTFLKFKYGSSAQVL